MLYESDILFEAFENMFIVAVMRHPVDAAFGWHRTGEDIDMELIQNYTSL